MFSESEKERLTKYAYSFPRHELEDFLYEDEIETIKSTGELVAWSGHKSNQEAVSTAAALFGLWNSQSETAGQHDDTLEVNITLFYR